MAAASAVGISACEWTVCYHQPGKMKGRGEFLRLMLEDAGVSYVNSAEDLYGPKSMMDAFRGSPEAIDEETSTIKYTFPVFFPPAIWHRPMDGQEVLINQVGACMIYLGEKLGYSPASAEEGARANSIMLNALDYISEGRLSFHPVKSHASYLDQKEEGDKASKEFSEKRMRMFLHHFNKIVIQNGGAERPIAGGVKATCADFCLFHVLDATSFQFNSDFYAKAWDAVAVPDLKLYYQWMKSRPNLQNYFKSDRCARKCQLKSVHETCNRDNAALNSCFSNRFSPQNSFLRRQYDVDLWSGIGSIFTG